MELCGCLLTLCSEYYLLPQSFVDGWALTIIYIHQALMITHSVWVLNIIYTQRALLMVTHTV